MGRIACMFRNLGGFHAHSYYCTRLLFRRDWGPALGTGFAGMSAAAVISPMLITFLGMDPYLAVGIALSSDVLASAVSAYTYGKNKNLDIRNGLIMMASVLAFTVVGSYIASIVPSATMGSFSVVMTFLLGVKFIVRPVMTTKEAMQSVSAKKRAVQSVVCGVIVGFTALVPMFGAFVGCLISALFIAMVDPMQALYFIIMVVCIQQVEGNLIYPHVVGNSVGLPALYVIVAISIRWFADGSHRHDHLHPAVFGHLQLAADQCQ